MAPKPSPPSRGKAAARKSDSRPDVAYSSGTSTPRATAADANNGPAFASSSNDPSPKQLHERPPQAPIRFYNDEVARMNEKLVAQRQDWQQGQAISRYTETKLKSERASTSGLLLRGFLLYTIASWLLVCPNARDDWDKQAICHAYDYTEAAVRSLNAHLKPYTDAAWREAQPYVAQVQQSTEPYVNHVRPYYQKADKTARYALEQRRHVHDTYIQPRVDQATAAFDQAKKPLVHALEKQYQKTLAPSVEWYSREYNEWYKAHAEPHVRQAQDTLRQYSRKAHDAASPIWTHGLPFAQKHFHETIVPTTKTTSRTIYSGYVNQVHPRLVSGGKHGASFLRAKVLPALQRFWSVFIAPQLDKISEKVHEYRAKKVQQNSVSAVTEAEKEVLGGSDGVEEWIAELRDLPSPESTATAAETSSAQPESTLSAEERKALNAEKRKALESLQASYEKEILKLGGSEHDLLVSRLVELRRNAVDDVPKRFNAPLVKLDEESDKMVSRFDKYFERAKSETTHSPEDKVAEAEVLGKQAVSKIRKLADNVIVEAQAYRDQLDKRETKATAQASEALDVLLAKAQEELAYGWTWLDDVTHKDWQRYHGLNKAVKNWKTNYEGLRTGAIEDESLTELKAKELLDEVEVQANSVVANFVTVLDRRVESGKRELRGDWTGVGNEASKAYDAAAETFGAAVEAVKSSASSLAGVQPSPTDVAGSVSSIASAASYAASSYADDVYDNVKAVYGDASQSVLEAVGVQPSPTDLRQSAVSVARSAAAAARSASKLAEAAMADASQTVVRAVGGEPRPTDVQQHATSVVKAARASVQNAYAGMSVGEAVSSASSVVDQARRTVVKAAGTASQSVVRAVGGEPSPTDVQQSVTSVAKAAQKTVSRQVERAVSKASSAASAVSSQASSAVKQVTGTKTAEGVSRSASSIVSKVKSLVNENVPHVEL
ncbi:hypothetical protein ACM66B_002076 [Microbotryomycetes sp. NB124-2]